MGLGGGDGCCWLSIAPPRRHLTVPAAAVLTLPSFPPPQERLRPPCRGEGSIPSCQDTGHVDLLRFGDCLENAVLAPHPHHTPCAITATPPKLVPSRDGGLGNPKPQARMQEGNRPPQQTGVSAVPVRASGDQHHRDNHTPRSLRGHIHLPQAGREQPWIEPTHPPRRAGRGKRGSCADRARNEGALVPGVGCAGGAGEATWVLGDVRPHRDSPAAWHGRGSRGDGGDAFWHRAGAA